ncbi:MAG: YncE family protein [Pyrinomonadaceae bacterium]
MKTRSLFRRLSTSATCLVALTALVAVAVTAGTRAAAPAGYHQVKTYKLGGEGGWDYLLVDSAARRVYISRGTHVMVVDADTGAVVGDIPDTAGVHGIALVPELNKGYTSNGRAGTVTVFDTKTLKTLSTVKVGQNPDAITYDDVSKRVFTFNGASKDATAIDVKTDTVAGTIPLGGKPETGVPDEHGHVFVNVEDKGEIVDIDSRKLTAGAHWSLAPCEEPTGLSMDRKHRRLFAGCGGNKLMAVVNADTGKLVTTLPVGAGVDAAGFDPETSLAFASGGDGTLAVVHEDSPDKYTVVENATTQRGARTMSLDTKTHRVYLVTAEFGPPPAATPERPRPRPSVVPGSFTLIVMEK